MHHGDNINWLHSILKHFWVGNLVVWVWTRIRYNIYLEISFIWVFWWLLRKKSVWCSSDSLLGFSDVSYKLNCFLRHVLMPSFPSFLCKLFAGDTDVPLCQPPPAILLHLHHCWPSNNLFRNLILLPPFWDFGNLGNILTFRTKHKIAATALGGWQFILPTESPLPTSRK